MDRRQVEFLLKLHDAALMIADAANDYLESLAPSETKDFVSEITFTALKFESQQGTKLGEFEVAFKANKGNPADKFTQAYDVLTKAKATIQERYHAKGYQFSYWLYGQDKIYRQKIKQGVTAQ